jgi:pimeloyl-ACP methyl ester carboxylesterase
MKTLAHGGEGVRIKLFGLIAAVMLVGIFSSATLAAAKGPTPIPGTHPMIFIHGGSGVGAQFESQAQRFESNGYPADWVTVYEYDSSFSINTVDDVYNGIDQAIAALLEKTGADQVDILGHSLGTTVMTGGTIGTTVTPGYLNTSADRAAKVANYVNIDGRTATELPGTVVGVPVRTLAIWAGRGVPGRQIVGATNVTIPDVTHVQSATCADSFVEMYKFFTGNEPATKDIVPIPPGQVRLSGRALFFPTNSGVPSGTLEIWRVNGDTGARLEDAPEAVYPISGDGAWGPFNAVGGKYYEFALLREGQFTHHFYYEPFLRSDHLIRLQTEPPGTGLGLYTSASDHTTNLIILRNKELWGDQGAENDALAINGVNIVSATTCPITKRVNAVFTFDKNLDGISDVNTPLFPFTALSFLLGLDLYIPGVTPPNATVPVVLTPRGGGDTQTINVPNWGSLTDRMTLQFHDYSQDINSWPEYVQSK